VRTGRPSPEQTKSPLRCSGIAAEETALNIVELFLAHAVQLEREAARRYEDLAASMSTDGNRELKGFFERMAGFSRKHLTEASARAGFRQMPDLRPDEYEWPDGTAPETAGWTGVDALMSADEALQLALESERRGLAYYAAIAATSQDPDVRSLAAQFAEEEAAHVRELEKWISARTPATRR
jgi:rubrerythrin